MDDKIILNVQIRQKIASLVNKGEYIVCGNDNYAIKFDFDDDFAGYKFKTAIFISQDDKVTEEVIFEGDTCDIPPIYDSKLVSIGVVADNVRTTTPAIVPCKLSISDLAGKVTPPIEDVYNQIMALLNQYIDKAVVTEEEVKQFVEEFLEGYEDIVTEKELADAVASVMAKINEQSDDIKELESISTVIVEGVSALEEDVADIDDRVSYLESFNLDYTEVSTDTGILPVPNNEFVGKKAFLNSFGGMTRRWEGYTYTATAGTSYGVYSYGAHFTLQAGTYRLVGGMGIELHINGALVSNPFTLTETTEITSFYEESGAAVGDGSTHTIYPYLLDIDTNTAIPFPNTWLGLQDTKPTAIKVHYLNLIPNTRDISLYGAGGLTYIDNGDGSYYVSGTATGAPSYIAININKAFPAGTYTFYGFSNGSKDTYRLRYMFNNKTVDVYNGGGVVAILDKGCVLQQILLIVQNGITVNNLLYNPMVVIGKQFNLPFTQYKEPVTKPIPDAIQTLNGYGKGISADYCNKVDLEAQTYTEQMETIELDGTKGVSRYGTSGVFYILLTDAKYSANMYVQCSHFKSGISGGGTTHGEGYVWLQEDSKYPRLYFGFSASDTIETVKAYFANQNAQGNPVTITYAKAEPTTTALPVALDGLVEVERGGFVEIVTDTGKGVPASATFVIPRE